MAGDAEACSPWGRAPGSTAERRRGSGTGRLPRPGVGIRPGEAEGGGSSPPPRPDVREGFEVRDFGSGSKK